MKRHLTALAAVTGVAPLASGCGGSSDAGTTDANGNTTIKVAVWNYATTPEFKALFDAYHAANPKVTVQPVDILADDYPTKVTTMLAGGDSTDVLTMKNVIDYDRWGGRGQLVDLTDKGSTLDKSTYAGLDAYDMKGKYYALPYRSDSWVLYYNKTLLKQAGVDESTLKNLTWAQYADLAKKLTKGDGATKVYGAYQHTWRSVVQAVAAAQTGGNLLGPDYSFMKDQYAMTLDLQKAGAIMDYSTAKTQKVSYSSVFETGKAALLPMGTWFAGGLIADTAKGKTDVQWGMAPLPQITAGSGVTTFGSPTAFGVNKKSKNQAEARKFVEWASGEAGAAVVAKAGVTPSFKSDAISASYFGLKGMPNDALAKAAFTSDKLVLEMPASDKSSDVDQILTDEHGLVMTGEKSVDDGIKEMGARVASEVG